jgi:phytoene synthase
MAHDSADQLPPEAELALAWSRPNQRARLRSALELDRRLARIVARTQEPMLGQMRLAWWRDALAKPVAERPRGDAVLDALGDHWRGRESALAAMVDAWEVLVTAERLGPEEAAGFGARRGAFFAALAPDDAAPGLAERLEVAGRCWALADAAAGVSDAGERAVLVAAGLDAASPRGSSRIPAALRGLAVLEALSLRALRAGGRPLMEGRGAPLAVIRAAIFRA